LLSAIVFCAGDNGITDIYAVKKGRHCAALWCSFLRVY